MKSVKSWLKSPLSNLKSKQYETETERLERLKQEVLAEGKTPTRRSFLARLGLGATLLALTAQAYAFLRSLKPNVLYEAPQRFKVGLPEQFGEGAKFLDDKRLFIFRQGKTFYLHLGCLHALGLHREDAKTQSTQKGQSARTRIR